MNLSTLDKLYAEATCGEWIMDSLDARQVFADDVAIVPLDDLGDTTCIENSRFIVALHNAYPSLAKRIRELEARCVDLEWAARRATDDGEPITRHLKD